MAIINDPSAYFQTKLYTGGTAEAKTFDGNSNLKPDLFWSKKRGAVQNHFLADSVRGTTFALVPNTTSVSYTNSETDDLASFDTNGFTFSGTGDTYNGTYQSSSYVAWCWSAGGGTASSNTDGSITSSVSANQDAGFSIVSWTNSGSSNETIGHGLGVAPKMIIIKSRSKALNWLVYHESVGNTKSLSLNTNSAEDDNVEIFNDTSPTSTVFTTGITGSLTGGSQLIAYCFAEKQGYSKFGSYTGNGSTDGTFVYTGFKPSWLMYKRTDTTGSWEMWDNKRSTFNPENKALFANSSDAEATASNLDFTSNGFKIRVSSGGINASGGSYIYMCFAENPFVSSTGVPATAR